MNQRKGHLYFSAFLLAVSGYAIYSALGWGFKTKLFPLATAIPIFILVLLHLYLEIFGSREVTRGPAVEAEFSNETADGAAQRRAALRDSSAGEAETDGALARREFVLHGVLRGAAAVGCPRRTS